jgi:hypothetical protein
MRKVVSVVALAAMCCLAVPGCLAKTPPAPKNGPGAIVIVFKDGHRVTFNLSEIERVEFPGSGHADADDYTGSTDSRSPSRAHFLGKWEVGDGSGGTFYITIYDDGTAMRSMGNVHGRWVYEDGEARVTWDDGPHDAIRKVGSRYQKFAYVADKRFTDVPDNVTEAHNTTPHPI